MRKWVASKIRGQFATLLSPFASFEEKKEPVLESALKKRKEQLRLQGSKTKRHVRFSDTATLHVFAAP